MEKFQNEDVSELILGPNQCRVRLQNQRQLRISTRTLLRELDKRNLSPNKDDLQVLFPNATIGIKYKTYNREELRKKWRMEKLLISIIVLVVIGGLVFILRVGLTFTNNNISDYPSKNDYTAEAAALYMPKISELPASKSIRFEDKTHNCLFYVSHSVQLVVAYDERTYEPEKKRILEGYQFLSYSYYSAVDKPSSVTEFQIGTYQFRILKTAMGQTMDYPKEIWMVATSDQNSTIVYLFYFDPDLDFIDANHTTDGMTDFIKSNFTPFWE